jgi:hypothetical protein
MVPEFVVSRLPVAGGGGMAQDTLFNRLFPYLLWGLVLLIICGIAASILRRIYRAPGSSHEAPDDQS